MEESITNRHLRAPAAAAALALVLAAAPGRPGPGPATPTAPSAAAGSAGSTSCPEHRARCVPRPARATARWSRPVRPTATGSCCASPPGRPTRRSASAGCDARWATARPTAALRRGRRHRRERRGRGRPTAHGERGDSIVVAVKSNGKLDTAFNGTGKVTLRRRRRRCCDRGRGRGRRQRVRRRQRRLGWVRRGLHRRGQPRSRAGTATAGAAASRCRSRSIALRPDGSVYVGGATTGGDRPTECCCGSRPTAVPTAASAAAVVSPSMPAATTSRPAIALQADGKLVVTGFGAGAAGHGQTIVRRFLADGSARPGVHRLPRGVRRRRRAVGDRRPGRRCDHGRRRTRRSAPTTTRAPAPGRRRHAGPDFGIDGATVVRPRSPLGGRRAGAPSAGQADGGRQRARSAARRRVGVPLPGRRRRPARSPPRGCVLDGVRRTARLERRLSRRARPRSRATRTGPVWDIARGVAVLPGLTRPRGGRATAVAAGSPSTTAGARRPTRQGHPVLARLGHRPRGRGRARGHRWVRARRLRRAARRSRSAPAPKPAKPRGYAVLARHGHRPRDRAAAERRRRLRARRLRRAPPRSAARPAATRAVPSWPGQDMVRGIAIAPTAAAGGSSTAPAASTRSASAATRSRRRPSAARTGRASTRPRRRRASLSGRGRRPPARRHLRHVRCRSDRATQRPAHHGRPVARRLPRRRSAIRWCRRRTSTGSPPRACSSGATTRRPRRAGRAGRRCTPASTS